MTICVRVLALLALTTASWAGEWSPPAGATSRDGTVLVTCRARVAGEYLLVEVTARDGWHVYAMDNETRAKEALAGKMSLGVEQSTEVRVSGGLEVVGNWLQTAPEDFSQPALRWYSYGFEGTAMLAAPVKRLNMPTADVAVRAQACDSSACISVDAEMEVVLGGSGDDKFVPDGLVPVRGI